MILWIILFIVSLFVLIKSADYFTRSSERIGLFFGISPFIVGVTIIAFGTSLPELISSIFAVIEGASEIVAGNVMGSNIVNILLVMGFAGLFTKKQIIHREKLTSDLTFLGISATILAIFLWDFNFSLIEAISSLVILVSYVIWTSKEKKENYKRKITLGKWTIPILILSGIGIYFGAKYTIDAVIYISDALGISSAIISASVVAVGTSLPEIVVSLVAARQGKLDMALGNVIGSNIFNSFAVMGIPSFFGSLILTQKMVGVVLPFMLIATVIFSAICFDKKITRRESVLLLLLYIAFLIILF